MSACVIINLILCLSLLTLACLPLLRSFRSRSDEVAVAPEEWNVQQAVRRLIEEQRELNQLYEQLGYSARLERESGEIMGELKALIKTEIPEFSAFAQALAEVRVQINQPATTDADSVVAAPPYQPEKDELLNAVLAAGDDHEQILHLLNRDPIYEQLPFIERIPINQHGTLIWRTPLEHSLIRKRPADPPRFAERLGCLEKLFRETRVPANKTIHQEALEAIARVRRDVAKPNAYMPTSLQTLEKKLSEYRQRAPNAAAQARIGQLDQLLAELLTTERSYQNRMNVQMSGVELATFRKTAQQLAGNYLALAWTHTPWLSARVLAIMFDAELAAWPVSERATPEFPAGVLRIIRDEIALGGYDSDETIRRLQQQEANGLYVNSLVYPLLRLNHKSSASTKQVGK